MPDVASAAALAANSRRLIPRRPACVLRYFTRASPWIYFSICDCSVSLPFCSPLFLATTPFDLEKTGGVIEQNVFPRLWINALEHFFDCDLCIGPCALLMRIVRTPDDAVF